MNLSFDKLKNATFFEKIGPVEKMLFTRHLAVMIKSGMPLSDALVALQKQTPNHAFQKMLSSIIADTSNGQSLEKTLSKHPQTFDPTYINMIKAGEKSGNLEQNLEYLSELLRKRYEFQKKVAGALLYPMLVLTTALVAGGGISIFVLPNLVDLFKSLDVKLPLTTKILIFFSNIMRGYGFFIVGGVFILLILFRIFIELPKIKPLWQKFLLSLPVLGPFLQNIELSSLCRNLGLMLKSGLSISKVLQSQYESTSNLVYKDYIASLIKSMEKGRQISFELSQDQYKYIPPIVTSMISVGEKTGKLDDSLIYLGDFFEDEVDNTAKNLSNVLEPALLFVIGIFVAFMALAIISPIYQLTSGIKR